MKFHRWLHDRNGTKTCVVMRGLPGSGKSHETEEVLREFGVTDRNKHVFSTDDWFVWDMLRVKRAFVGVLPGRAGQRQEAEQDVQGTMGGRQAETGSPLEPEAVPGGGTSRRDPVIVDNVNVNVREIRDYADYAKAFGYQIVIREPSSPWWKEHRPMLHSKEANADKLDKFAKFLAARNSHGVPEHAIARYIRRWQPDLKPEDVTTQWTG